jgi:predicted permease
VVAGFFVVLMGLILIIACMNLATMLLARGANRRKELAIRLGVGASRFRLIRQMISEGILLSLMGGVAGFALAYGLSALNSQLQQPAGAPLAPDVALDWRAAVFAFAVAIVCGIGFSLAPALQATKTNVASALKEGSALQLPGYRRLGLRNLAVVVQLTGSLMLLLITGFLVIGLSKANSIETKFDPKTMVLVSIDPVRDGYTPEKAQALFEKLPELLRNSGAVRKFALAAQPPFSIEDEDETIKLTASKSPEDSPEVSPEGSRVQTSAIEETAGAGYFAALNEPMLAGREFEELDERSQPGGSKADGSESVALPAVLNASAARAFFGNRNAIGRQVQDDKRSYEVVGVVPDLKDGSGMSFSMVYVPLTRRDFARPPAGGITIIVRSDAGTDALTRIRSVIASIDPHLTLFNVQTLSEFLERSRYVMWSALRTYGGIGIFGLVLSAIGLAGVTAYAVAQRRREIGIRMALGARQGQILRLVLREGAVLITVGTILGFLGTIAMARILSAMTSLLVEAFKVGTNDPRLIIGAPLLLAALAMLACYVPARTAAKVEPWKALREQ